MGADAFRMYCRWGERHGFKVTTLDFLDGDEAGLKSASILIEGENAYGFMKSETGIHRLVRVSPFDAAGRRHTSFASVEVMPEIDDTVEVEIAPEDIKWMFTVQAVQAVKGKQNLICRKTYSYPDGNCCSLPG